MHLTGALLSQSLKSKNKLTLKKFLTFSQKKAFLIFLENGTFNSKLEKIKKKIHPEEISFISGNGTFNLQH